MANLGFLSRPGSKGTQNFNGLWKLACRKEENNHIAPLTSPFISQGAGEEPLKVQFSVHYNMGKPSTICERSYSDVTTCTECEKTNTFGGPNYPTTVLCFIGYHFDAVGKTRKSKKGTVYTESPVKVVELPRGKSGINWEDLLEVEREGKFMSSILRIKRRDSGIYSTKIVSPSDLGSQFNPTVPQEIIDEWSGKTLGEQIGYCLSVYDGVRWNHPDLKGDGIVPPSNLVIESSADFNPPDDTDLDSDIESLLDE